VSRRGPALALALALVLGAPAAAGPPPGAGGLTALVPRDALGPNLLENPGFETEAGGAPVGWALRGGAWSLAPAGRGGRLALELAPGPGPIPSAEQTVRLEPGFYTLEAWVRTAELGSDGRSGVRVCLDGRPRLAWWTCSDPVRGTVDWTPLRRPMLGVVEPGTYRVTVGAWGRPDGRAWFDDVRLARVADPPLDVFLLYPNFRGMLFDDRPQTVRVAVAVADPRPGTRVRLALVPDAGGAPRAVRELAAAARLTAELDAAALPLGAYRLRAELAGPDGATLARYPDYRIVKLPAAVRRRFTVWVDEDNVVHLEDRRAFVLGIYTTSGYSTAPESYARGRDGWGTARLAEAPFNLLINYWLGIAPVPALEALMDDLHARGIYYLQTVNFYHADDPQYRTIPYPVAREGDEALNRWVAATLARHRGLAGFYTADERPAEAIPRVFRQYLALRDAAPGTVTYAVLGDGWEHQAPLWRDAVDVLGLDPYPITRPPGQNRLAMVGEWTRLGREAVQGSRPVWMVIQYFPLTTAGGWPSEEDLRTMSWMAIVEGARGLFYWSYGARGLAWVKDPAERLQRWQALVRVTREIKALEPVLLAPDAPLARDVDGPVRWLGKRAPDGSRYLFAYNPRDQRVRAAWTLAEPAREAVELGSERAVALAAPTRLEAEFGPYEVRRFRLR